MQGVVLDEGELLDGKGILRDSGYAFSQVKRYDRKAIKGKRFRIKEWDYYCFGDDKYMVALTVADNSYMSLGSVSVIDFRHLRYITESKIGLFSMGKLGMPSNCSSGDVSFKKGNVNIEFRIAEDGTRKLACEYKKFDKKRTFRCEVECMPAIGDNITVAIPFEKRKHFYYNTKINSLKCNGWFELGDMRYEFNDARGGLDWGRGVWPYKNKWFWSSLSCTENGTEIGFNLGYGFGKPIASENTIFVDGKAHKLGKVEFDIPYTEGEVDYLKPWKIVDDKQRLDIKFYPMIDRKDKMRFFGLMTEQHQVFGKFYGKAVLDDGTIITVTDKTGFAEHVVNQW